MFPNIRFLIYVVNAKLLINFQYVVVGRNKFLITAFRAYFALRLQMADKK